MLDSPVSTIPSVGPRFSTILAKVGINSVKDLIFYFPYRYEDYSQVSEISSVQAGEVVTVKGQVIDIKTIYTRTGKRFQQAHISDGTQTIEVVWFNQPFLVKTLPPGSFVSLSGKVDQRGKKVSMVSPKYEKLQGGILDTPTHTTDTLHTGRLVPVYSETSGLSSKWLRSKISLTLPHVIDEVQEILPDFIRTKYQLLPLKEAVQKAHFPETPEEAQKARERLGFDEFLSLQLNNLLRKKKWEEKKVANKLVVDNEKVKTFVDSLPFELTESQKTAIKEILVDLQEDTAMNRMLEGDVGSGKTIVAATACYISFLNDYQSAIMAPTQILATQHFNTLSKLLAPLGIKVALITGESKSKIDSKVDIYVGTHALIQNRVDFENLALIVIDEQHRFGVSQRAKLAEKTKEGSPHVLTMTATPIPRTVALTAYGDLDVSILTDMPKGRLKIKTWVVPPQKRESAYGWIRSRVQGTDEQAFIICPLIEESEAESLKSVKAATVEFERLSKEVFPDLRLGLLHGRVKGKEKDEIMSKFKNGEMDILVATPVVEVGIDIPRATIILIEAAERFGLAQLHQLRGRVGRGNKQSYCLLFTESKSQTTETRLRALERSNNGLELAELDLKMRGPGEVFGTAQHGFPELKVGSYSDFPLIKKARETAEELIDKIDEYPTLKEFIKGTSTPIAPN